MPEVHSKMSVHNDTVTTVLSAESRLSREVLWRALVMPEQLRHWLGHVAEPLTEGTEFVLSYLNGSDHRVVGTVTRADEPSTLEFTWRFNGGSESQVRVDLEETNSGTKFTLTRTGVEIDQAAADAASWHAQIDFLSFWLHDRIALGAALRERRNELIGQYEAEVANALCERV